MKRERKINTIEEQLLVAYDKAAKEAYFWSGRDNDLARKYKNRRVRIARILRRIADRDMTWRDI